MMDETHTKTYGAVRGYHRGEARWFVSCGGRSTNLHYARYETAMQKAAEFVKRCHRDFIRNDGTEVKFKFEEEINPSFH